MLERRRVACEAGKMPLTFSVQRSGQMILVTPSGDIDLDTIAPLREVLQNAVATPAVNRIEVNMRKVTVLDSSGIAVFVVAHRAAADRGITLVLQDPGPTVRLVLDVTNLSPMLVDEPRARPAEGPFARRGDGYGARHD
jgi:anti-sigma B factor antagonist